jgi:predicted MFS family arabinose efflux permease
MAKLQIPAVRRGFGNIKAMRAFRHRNFRWYWFGAIGLTMAQGMQQLTLAWLVLELTDSVSQLGIAVFLQGLPMLLFMAYGGVLTDRLDRVKLLFASQLLIMPVPLALGVLAELNQAHVWQIYIGSLFVGAIQAVVFPARQAIIRDVVERDDVMNAVALHATLQNFTQIVGPSLAGFVIAFAGISTALYINSSLYVFGVIGLLMMRGVQTTRRATSTSVLRDMADGVRHIRGIPSVFALILLGYATGFFVLPVAQMMPAFAREELNVGADGAGLLLMFAALGAVVANAALAVLSDLSSKHWILLWSTLVHSVSLIVFSMMQWYAAALAVMLVVGVGRMVFVSLGTTFVQLLVSPAYTGRALSLWYQGAALIFVGALPMGLLGDAIGLRATIAGSAFIYMLFSLWIGFSWPHIRNMGAELSEPAATTT